MDKIKGRHWVFIAGFLSSALASIYSPEVAMEILEMLFYIGVVIYFAHY